MPPRQAKAKRPSYDDAPEAYEVATPTENKQQRFERLATRRTQAALRRIRMIGNLANRQSYEYTDSQVEEMFAALDAGISDARRRFENRRDAPAFRFSFGDEQ